MPCVVASEDRITGASMRRVFACGDAVRLMASVALAVGDGYLAEAAAHRSLMSDPMFETRMLTTELSIMGCERTFGCFRTSTFGKPRICAV